ncbi:MAG: hypothetical protein WBC73_03520 [Phormidesmis sp.]
MTKKRIADLLKEEVEKPATGKAADSNDSEGKATAKKRTAKTTAKTAAKTPAKTTAKTAATKTPAKTPAKSAAKSTAKASSASKNSAQENDPVLTSKISDLEAALQKSTAQISALQDDIETHQDRIFELKDSLEKAQSESQEKESQLQKLSAELKEAKQVILNLSATHQDAAIPADPSQTKSQITTTEPAAAKASENASKARQSLSVTRPRYSSYKSIPEYAIDRGTPLKGQNNSMMSDDDIGWVD